MDPRNIIVLIILVYLFLNIVLGIWINRRHVKNAKSGFLSEYFLGGRSMGGVVLAMTLIATYTSASSFLGGPGLASVWGLTQSWVSVVQIGATFLTLGVIGKKFALVSREINAVSVSDYLRARYNSKLIVIITSLGQLFFFVALMVAQFIGGATLLETVIGIPYEFGLLIFAAVVIVYTACGGFRAVVITDTLQGFLMILGTFMIIIFMAIAGGGLDNLISTAGNTVPGWMELGLGEAANSDPLLAPGFLVSYWVLVGVAVIGLPQTSIRAMGFKDTKSMHRAMLIGTIVVGILMLGMHFAGALAGPLIEQGAIQNTDQVVPYIINKYMPAWAAGLFLAAPLAAIMSTVDSLLILSSATLIEDIYNNFLKNTRIVSAEAKVKFFGNKNLSLFSITITILLGIAVMLIALYPPDIIVWVNLFALGGLEAVFFWPIVGGLYWKRGTKLGCLASILAGLGTFLFFHFVDIAPFGVHEIVMGLLAGGLVFFAVGYFDSRRQSNINRLASAS